jgi:4-hydroxythreonine-4-phosphate dehydrogenase
MGDVNGISTEIIIKALTDNRLLLDCTPVVYGAPKAISHYRKEMEDIEFNFQTCKTIAEIQPKKVNFIAVFHEELLIEEGKPTELSGKISFLALEAATKDLASGKIDVLVTAPISKDAMQKSGFKFPGHTEYLADMANSDALMVLCNEDLRVALATTHVPLKEVSGALTKELLLSKVKMFEASLQKDFGIRKPKIALLGLNPHAGENGKLGSEEQEVILPSIEQLRRDGVLAFGPFPADGFFGSNQRSAYDGVLAMYHDQGLTGFKAIAFEDGVNFTAGLPIVRTSPDHGTGYDIAGKNLASAQSMRSAIYLAMDIHRNRKLHKEINANKLIIEKVVEKKRENSIE